ncbi:hypothetical protein QBC39DRAFT_26203 [Podospora conica]|nr:hypothetical protein QBC39DRAFT_26203 [Schizothecium conicum]
MLMEMDLTWRLKMVKEFPQHLLPLDIDVPEYTGPFVGCVLSLVVRPYEHGDFFYDDNTPRAQRLVSFQDGEALADTIITYGPYSRRRDRKIILKSCIGLGVPLGTSFNPLTLGFITGLGVEPEDESAEEESARLLLQKRAAQACTKAIFFGKTARVKASQCDCYKNCRCPGDLLRPSQLVRSILEFRSIANLNLPLSEIILMLATPYPLRTQLGIPEFHSFWLPFWVRLINMDRESLPLEACVSAFLRMLGVYDNKLWLAYHGVDKVVQSSRHNKDSLTRSVYDWLMNTKSTAAFTATRSLRRLKRTYDGLHGEYLATRVTAIPGTNKGSLFIVKRFQKPIEEEDAEEEDVKPFRHIQCLIRAELEWRLFTEFRPMLPFLSAEDQNSLLGHSKKLDRDVRSLDDAYLEAFTVPNVSVIRPRLPVNNTEPAAARSPHLSPVVAAPAPVARTIVKVESPASSPEPPAQAGSPEDGAEVGAEDTDVASEPDSPAVESPVQTPAGGMDEPRPRRGIKRRASAAAEVTPRRMGLRSQSRRVHPEE